MPKVVFMRHAKTTLNKEGKFAGRTDCDVLPEGLEKLKEVFPYTAEDFDYYYCSPLKRPRQTLEAVIPGIDPIIDERIIERDLGEWEATLCSNYPEEMIEAYIKGLYNPPGSESYGAVTRRVRSFVEDLFSKYKEGDRILVVSHAGILRQVRDVFLPNMPKGKIKNSGTITVTDEDFKEYMKRKEEAER